MRFCCLQSGEILFSICKECLWVKKEILYGLFQTLIVAQGLEYDEMDHFIMLKHGVTKNSERCDFTETDPSINRIQLR